MKKGAVLFLVVLLFLLLAPVALSAQEQGESQKITIKAKEVSSGIVVLVAVQGGKNSFELQCNKGLSGCTILEPGDYMMVRLPKNRGLYDCANAEVYKISTNSGAGEKIGQYCLVETK